MTDNTWICPRCQTEVFNKPQCDKCGLGKGQTFRAEPKPDAGQRVVVTDFDMPFGSMVGFMIKWSIAAIPALFILAVVGFFGFAFLTALLTQAYQ